LLWANPLFKFREVTGIFQDSAQAFAIFGVLVDWQKPQLAIRHKTSQTLFCIITAMETPPKTFEGLPVRLFKSLADWAAWMEKNHGRSTGLWLRIAKKGSDLRSASYQEALEIALCYGWIDGQKRPESEDAWLQKFVPRSSRSIWSKINQAKALKLIASGQMKAAGLEAIENAKKNGRWESAYDSPAGSEVPADFQAGLDGNPRAAAFFRTLNRANRYAILWRIQTVKRAETRARKIETFIIMLERGEKIHS